MNLIKFVLCGFFKLNRFHIDHNVPLAEGGTNDKSNLQLLCVECHFFEKKNKE
jgi:5-methylcytosine-specific restriction endonuclease McrA